MNDEPIDSPMDSLADNLAELGVKNGRRTSALVKQSSMDESAPELDHKLSAHERGTTHPTRDLSNTNNIRLRLNHLLPSENLDYFCRDYFTDEDFLHETLELPPEILAEVAHSPSELVDYLKTMCTASTGFLAQSGATAFSLNSRPPGVGLEFNVNGTRLVDELGMDNGIVFRQMCDTYAQILDYYSGCEYYGHSPDLGFWPDDFVNRVWQFCVVIHQDYVLDPQSPINCSRLEQELAHGIGMITTQIDMIKSHYAALATECHTDNSISGPISLDDLTPEHTDRFIRLTNNLCVLMIFIKFYYSDGIQPDELRFKK